MSERKLLLAENLLSLTEKNRISIRELSKMSGVPASTLSEWTGKRVPKNPTQVSLVAEALGVTMHQLLFGEDDPMDSFKNILKSDVFSGLFEIQIKRVDLNKVKNNGGKS